MRATGGSEWALHFSLEALPGGSPDLWRNRFRNLRESAWVLCRRTSTGPWNTSRGGEQNPGLSLNWSGPGLDGTLSLVRKDGISGAAIAGAPPQDPPPSPTEPVAPGIGEGPVRTAPESMSQDLIAYWSLDRRTPKSGSRYTVTERGVEEKLIMKGQPLRYFRPAGDPGELRWERPGFDDSDGWMDGRNGKAEDAPGELKDFETTIEQRKASTSQSVSADSIRGEDPKAYKQLALYIQYDDGFKAYLNGSTSVGMRFPFL